MPQAKAASFGEILLMEDVNFSPDNKNILIAGAGIAGTTLAYWLNRYGFAVTVVEKAPGIRKAGYRVDIRGAAVQVAECMGIMDSIREHHSGMTGAALIDSRGHELATYDDPELYGLRAPGEADIMRGELARILYDSTRDDVEYIFGDAISGMTENKSCVQVRFSSGAKRTFDLVIGADGMHSGVRRLAFGEAESQVRHSGYHFALFNIPNFAALDGREWSGRSKGAAFRMYSSGNSQATALLLFDAKGTEFAGSTVRDQKRLLSEHFSGARGVLQQIIRHLPGASNFYLDSIGQVFTGKLWKGRVALLGDAGYCTSPLSRQGTSLAIVGAYVLAGELAAAGGDHRAGFRNYSSRMQAFIDLNRPAGNGGLRKLIPRSIVEVYGKNMMNRLMFHLPFGEKMIGKLLRSEQEKMHAAANGIELKDYTPEEDWAEWLRVFRELIVDRV